MEIDENIKEIKVTSTDSTNTEKFSKELKHELDTKNNKTASEKVSCTENKKISKSNNEGEEKKVDVKVQLDPLQETFKKPVLIIGPRKGHPTKLRTVTHNTTTDKFENSVQEQQSNNNTEKKLLLSIQTPEIPEILQNKIIPPYIEPSWSGIPEETYKLEVLKSGVILEIIDLSKKSYHVVGRSHGCDIAMAHPTISRFHAVIQYKKVGDDKNGKGFYVYDLDSTHGTFWNGNRIKPKVYVRLQGNHMIRFGCSQRKFIVQAPLDDQDEESKYSVTELKEMRKHEFEERERLEKQRLREEETEEKLRKEKEENEGIDWGMGEDADEETDLTENPYAQTNNEELFLDDPKKTLRGWFEREGYNLEYQTEDKGIGRFLCWVELPIDNNRIVRAEALVSGKKKEAVIQCALEACRILDRYGLLRQATHEARKRKTRNWEEEDYYDSDEDNFLDRTGTVEKKREQRMKMAGKLETKAETYDSLLEKHSIVSEKISNIENVIALQKMKQEETDDSNLDALDAFMTNLGSSTLNKTEIRKMKIELLNLRKEEIQLLKLINIAKPSNLPPLKPHVPNIVKKSKKDFKDLKSVIGHKKKLKFSVQKSQELSKPVIEEDDNENDQDNKEKEEKMKEINERIEVVHDKIYKMDTKAMNTEDKCDLKTEIEEILTASENTMKEENVEVEENEKDNLKKKKKNVKRNQQRMEKNAKELKKGYDEDEFREDYNMWLPPENQSGDGKTSLNEKFGY